MSHVTGRLEVHDRFVDLKNIAMRRGTASVDINGRITWKSNHGPATTQPVGPNLHVVARNLPLDDELKGALPAAERDWLVAVGATGLIEVEGNVTPSKVQDNSPNPNVDFLFNAHLHNGALWPLGNAYALSGISAQMRITPTSFVLTDMTAKRGTGDIAGHLSIAWSAPAPGEPSARPPRIMLSAIAENVPLEPALYAALPDPAKQAWDEIQPQGSINATVEYASALSGAPDPDEKLDLQIHPVQLSVKPQIFPYRMDDVHGLLSVSPTKVLLKQITAHHGKSALAVTGEGDLGEHPEWVLKLTADPVPLDADAIAAVPETVSDIIKTLKLTGSVGLDFSRLAYRPGSADAARPGHRLCRQGQPSRRESGHRPPHRGRHGRDGCRGIGARRKAAPAWHAAIRRQSPSGRTPCAKFLGDDRQTGG